MRSSHQLWRQHDRTLCQYRILNEHNQQAALDRAQLYIESMHKSLMISTHDYAEWRDSIRFIHGNLPTYLDENFNAGTLDNLNAHFVLFIRPDHSLYRVIGRGERPT